MTKNGIKWSDQHIKKTFKDKIDPEGKWQRPAVSLHLTLEGRPSECV